MLPYTYRIRSFSAHHRLPACLSSFSFTRACMHILRGTCGWRFMMRPSPFSSSPPYLGRQATATAQKRAAGRQGREERKRRRASERASERANRAHLCDEHMRNIFPLLFFANRLLSCPRKLRLVAFFIRLTCSKKPTNLNDKRALITIFLLAPLFVPFSVT